MFPPGVSYVSLQTNFAKGKWLAHLTFTVEEMQSVEETTI